VGSDVPTDLSDLIQPVGKRRRLQSQSIKENSIVDIGNNRSSKTHRAAAASSSSKHPNSDSPSPVQTGTSRLKRRRNHDDDDDDDDNEVNHLTNPLQERRGRMYSAQHPHDFHRDNRGTSRRTSSTPLLTGARRSVSGSGHEQTGRTRKQVSYKDYDNSSDNDEDAVESDAVTDSPQQRPATRNASSVSRKHVTIESSSRNSKPIVVKTRSGRGRRIQSDEDEEEAEDHDVDNVDDDDEDNPSDGDDDEEDDEEDDDEEEHQSGRRQYSTRRSTRKVSSPSRSLTIKKRKSGPSHPNNSSIGTSSSTRSIRGASRPELSPINSTRTTSRRTAQLTEPHQRSSRFIDSIRAAERSTVLEASQPSAQRSSRRLGSVADESRSSLMSGIPVIESNNRSNRRVESINHSGTDRSIALAPRQNMTSSVPIQPPTNRRLDPDLKRRMLETVSYADDLDRDHHYFAEPVSEDAAPDYFDIISNPMDLQKIR